MGAMPRLPVSAAARSDRMSACRLLATMTSIERGLSAGPGRAPVSIGHRESSTFVVTLAADDAVVGHALYGEARRSVNAPPPNGLAMTLV